MSKILKKVVPTQLFAYLCDNHLLSDKQFGFRLKASTVTATAQFTGLTTMDNGMVTSAVFIDLTKAFDSVNHSLLLSKLNSLSVLDHSTARKWFESYLSNRCQVSACNNSQSDKAVVPILALSFCRLPCTLMTYQTVWNTICR